MVRTIISLFGVFTGLALLFSFLPVSDADWTVLREDDILRGDGIEGMLQDVYFMDSQNGMVVGDGGLMLKTSDGGKTWEKVEIDMSPPGAGQRPGAGGGGPPSGGFGRGGPAPLYNIYFMDENVGYITGGRGTILKTEDGGKTWARKMARSDTPGRGGRRGGIRANLMGIQMISETTGFIAGSENTILKTTMAAKLGSAAQNAHASVRPGTILRISGSFHLQRVGLSAHSGHFSIPLMAAKIGRNATPALIITCSGSTSLMKTPVGSVGRRA